LSAFWFNCQFLHTLMSVKSFFKGAGFIVVVTIVAKMIGAFYRIPLTNIVGAEGIGLYQMVFPLYSVLFTISAGGISGAIAKAVKKRFERGDEQGARQVFFVSLSSLSFFAVIFTLFIVLLRNQLAFIQGNSSASIPYLAIAPALIFSAFIACFRGYFQGRQNMVPSALSLIIEQLIKLSLGLFLARYLLQYSIELAVFGALMGVALGELVSLLSLFVLFLITHLKYRRRTVIKLREKRKSGKWRVKSEGDVEKYLITSSLLTFNSSLSTFKQTNSKKILSELFGDAIPLIFASLIMPFVAFIDSIMVINILISQGVSTSDATAMFGLLNGPINSLINMPLVITFALSTSLVPKVKECLKGNQPVCEKVGKHFKFSVIVSILAILILGIYAYSILNTVYHQGLTESQIRLGSLLLTTKSIAVFYVATIQISSAVLEAAKLSHKGAINLLIGAILKIILTLVLLPYIGVIGAAVGTVACFSLTAILNTIAMRRHVNFSLKVREVVVAPIVSGVVFAGISLVAIRFLPNYFSPTIALLSSLVIGGLLYLVCLFLFRAIKKSEVTNFLKN